MKIAVHGTMEAVKSFTSQHGQYTVVFGDWEACAVGLIMPGTTNTAAFEKHCARVGIPVIYPELLEGMDWSGIINATAKRAHIMKVAGQPPERCPIEQRTPTVTAHVKDIPDIIMVGWTTQAGHGGGERSMQRICSALRRAGFSTLYIDWAKLQEYAKMGIVYPKAFIVQSHSPTDYLTFLQGMYPNSLKIQYTQTWNKLDDRAGWDAYLCNSYTTQEYVRSKGCSPTAVQFPLLNSDKTRVLSSTRETVVCLDMLKGGDVAAKIAEAMPKQQFVGLFTPGQPEYSIPPNMETHGWVNDIRKIYRRADVVIFTGTLEEGFGRGPAECIGNGIPCIVGDYGNLPWFGKEYPDCVTVMRRDATPDDWREAITKAGKRKPKPHTEVWEWGIDNLLALLKEHGIKAGKKKPPLSLPAGGGAHMGIGDAWMLWPTLEELTKTFRVFLCDHKEPAPGLEVFDLAKRFNVGTPPLGSIPIRLVPVADGEPESVWRFEARHRSFARRACAEPLTWQPNPKLNKKMLADVRRRLPKTKRKRVGFSFQAGNAGRTMAPQAALPIAQLLAESGYEVYLFHKGHTFNGRNVNDMGGEFTTKEMIHAVSLMDAVVGVDSGVAHTAAALKVPLVVMLGAVGQNCHIRYDDYEGKVVELYRGLVCQPCWDGARCGCAHSPECLVFPATEVLAALKEVMK